MYYYCFCCAGINRGCLLDIIWHCKKVLSLATLQVIYADCLNNSYLHAFYAKTDLFLKVHQGIRENHIQLLTLFCELMNNLRVFFLQAYMFMDNHSSLVWVFFLSKYFFCNRNLLRENQGIPCPAVRLLFSYTDMARLEESL